MFNLFCLKLYIFAWTSILKQSAPGGMNIRFIFITIASALIIGTGFHEILIAYLLIDYYINSLFDKKFFWSSFLLSLFNELLDYIGLYTPLNSLIKSNILSEGYKYTIMNLFCIPINIYAIVIFLHLNYKNCFYFGSYI